MKLDTKVRIEDKLFLVKFKPDHEPHLAIISQDVCRTKCSNRPCTFFCPARVYEWEESDAKMTVGFENCLECGACRIGCPHQNIDWRYPRGGVGVTYRYG
ncbi:MAG: 4Fe-4S dicluster domain-containing protein [Chloroflexi bacterium]|nr:4Fe-4S dicluster domain-containing protein [Chloroflexota bacterium]